MLQSLLNTVLQTHITQKKPGRLTFRAFETLSICEQNLVGVDRDLFTILAQALELYDAFDQREKGVIPATSNIVTRVNLCSTLTVDDIAGFYDLAAEFFTAESLTI